MTQALWIPAASFLLCFILTPLARKIARQVGLVDHPDGRRKLQHKPIPVAGGLAILVSAGTVLTIALIYRTPTDVTKGIAPENFLGLLLGSIIISVLGVADDAGQLRGRHKLLGQLLAAIVVVYFGVHVQHIHLFNLNIELGLLSYPFTIFFLLGAINSLNLIDGMDGLLGTVALIVTGSFAMLALVGGHYNAAWAALSLVGAIMAFLCYNLPPASIYLGDSGSMLIGLSVGVLGIQSSLKAPATVALAAPLALMTIPIIDTTAAILRRKLTGRSLYTTDRGHIHHCLLHRGYSRWKVLLLVSSLCFVTVLGSLGSLAYRNEMLAVISAFVVVAILVVSKLFGHVELRMLRKRFAAIVQSLFIRPHQGSYRQEVMQLQGSLDWGDFWNRLTDTAIDLELNGIRLDLNAPVIQEGYHARWDKYTLPIDEDRLCRVEIPLMAYGQVLGRVEFTSQKELGCLVTKLSVISKLTSEIEMVISALVVSHSQGHAKTAHTNIGLHLSGKEGPTNGSVGGLPRQSTNENVSICESV